MLPCITCLAVLCLIVLIHRCVQVPKIVCICTSSLGAGKNECKIVNTSMHSLHTNTCYHMLHASKEDCIYHGHITAPQYRPVAVTSHFPWNFYILSGSRHLGVPKYTGFICSIDQNVSCVIGKRLYSFNSLHSNHISSDSTHTRSIVGVYRDCHRSCYLQQRKIAAVLVSISVFSN